MIGFKNVTLSKIQVVKVLRSIPFLLLFLFQAMSVQASHIKAADLYAKVNPNNSSDKNAHRIIQYTLNVYADKNSVDLGSGTGCSDMLGNCAKLDFGDGSNSGDISYTIKKDIGNNTFLFVYYFTHTYPADQFYEASYLEENRNGGIQNLSTPSSALPFFIKMGLTIERGLGSNQTPQMSIPPIDLAEQNRIFIHNSGAYDIDGDSISFQPYQPQIATDIFDNAYVDPNLKFGGTTQDGSSSATYSVNPISGDVIWNAPQKFGLYNIAFIIEEWRIIGPRRQRISYSIRDMQINVKEGFNHPPVVKVRNDSCISPNIPFQSVVEVRDPDSDPINLTTYGELFEISNLATVTDVNIKVNTPKSMVFSWKPDCSNVRNRPYQAFFKATDVVVTGPSSYPLTDIKSFYLTVVGPSPTGLTVTPDTLKPRISLKWDPYSCAGVARKMEVYRRVGCDTVKIKNCVLGKPSDEYVLVGSVDIGINSFIDSTVKRGNIYSYSISALFVDNFRKTANSYPSKNVCEELPVIAPVITKVSFEGSQKNQILIKWSKPIDLDTNKVQSPYEYSLYRKIVGNPSYQLLIKYPPSNILYDSSYLDTDIKPQTNYVYVVELTYRTKGVVTTLADSSDISTNVELKTTSISKGIHLEWKANTPWQNGVNGFYHVIWRKGKTDTQFVRIDSVTFNQNVTVFSYNDYTPYNNKPLTICDTFTYFVTTSGSYLNDKVSPKKIVNNSFNASGSVLIDLPPASPVLNELIYDCNNFSQTFPYKNVLNWSKSSTLTCISIAGYNVYRSSNQNEGEMVLLANLDTNSHLSFSHSNLNSVAGCYVVTAFDNVGNESTKSNKVCVENCNLFELPNVFTPNNSGVNDLFRPIPPSPRFVETVKFVVFNRWGSKVFERDDDVNLNWDGSGLPDGIYFYTARVKFFALENESSTKDLKGWIQIIR